MKILMMGSYPHYQYSQKLGIFPKSEKRAFSCNQVLAESMASIQGFQVNVITSSRQFRDTRIIRDGNLNVTYFVTPPKANMFTLFQYTKWRILKRIEKIKPDIVHGIGTEHLWPYIAVSSSYPSVITMHGIMSEVKKNIKIPSFSRLRIFCQLERYVLKRAKHLIAISPYVESVVRPQTKAAIYPVENATHNFFFAAKPNPLLSRNILFVGNLSERKSVLDLLIAYKELCLEDNLEYRLILVGPKNKNRYSQRVQHYLHEHKLEAKVKIKGFLLPQELMKEYENAAFLVLPSVQETAPGVVTEAMSVGIPVIATRLKGIEHMVIDGKSGSLFPAHDISALKQQMRVLIENPRLRNDMGKLGRSIAVRRWYPGIITERTLEVYRTVLGRRNKI
jgi:glycosyltransferase involved in cell wall biosynthesis